MKYLLLFFCISLLTDNYSQEIDTSLNGTIKVVNELGGITSIITYLNGIENGEFTNYRENGTIEYQGLRFEGKRHGTNIWYDHYNDNSFILINYNNGIKDGEWIKKTENTKIRGFYCKNIKCGIWYYYHNRKLVRTEEYEKGVLLLSIDYKN